MISTVATVLTQFNLISNIITKSFYIFFSSFVNYASHILLLPFLFDSEFGVLCDPIKAQNAIKTSRDNVNQTVLLSSILWASIYGNHNV